ncbi:MAG: YajQ family cyclic di-GMP-binding protein [Candidatus Nanopelagicales bacterium]|nr:YajQ family cyclic di-GMP-binding protein [Candidatus Nanopelagicales bacterium]MDZ4250576.1 YajQ family cyclic di-GMP-binding protein [Candidatus Nanopelagicales bacterium]
MADSSFDVVSKVDRQEADNALNQCSKELRQRFDFRNTGASVEWASDLSVLLRASTEERALAALDVFEEKLVKRGVSLKSLEADDPKPSGKEHRITATFQSGLTSEQARSISKIIREEGPKAVKIQIQGDEVRVSGKKRDDLQAVISLIKEKDLDFAVQFTNYR